MALSLIVLLVSVSMNRYSIFCLVSAAFSAWNTVMQIKGGLPVGTRDRVARTCTLGLAALEASAANEFVAQPLV